MSSPVTRVCMGRSSRVAHLLSVLHSPNVPDPALCGREPLFYWRGTGTQEEEELAGSLPLCKRCVKGAEARGFEVPE